jgi:prephenate dehydratase
MITDFFIESDNPCRLESFLQGLKIDLQLIETRSLKTMHVTDYFFCI